MKLTKQLTRRFCRAKCMCTMLWIVNMFGYTSVFGQKADMKNYKLIWSDEFDKDGAPDSTKWSFEHGFVRNEEDQWYQQQNAQCKKGLLIIEARAETKPNPNYVAGSKRWSEARPEINYTSASLNTRGKFSCQFGRFVLRARIDTRTGLWPAWWTLGVDGEWPSNGEIDIMEYYTGDLLANIAIGSDKRYKPIWYSHKSPISKWGADWSSKFHTWRMDWDDQYISLYVDDLLLNQVQVSAMVNKDGSGKNPFLQPHYLLLNLALGGVNGGPVDKKVLPAKFEIDYVRVYQSESKSANSIK